MGSVRDTLPAALGRRGSSGPDDAAEHPDTVQKLVSLPVYCLSGAYAGFWPTMQWAAVLPLPAPDPPEAHMMRGGRVDVPAGAHVETSGPMNFEHVTFCGAPLRTCTTDRPMCVSAEVLASAMLCLAPACQGDCLLFEAWPG